LKTLSLSGNKLKSIPEEIGQITTLRNLYLSRNQLTLLPETLVKLSQLTDLDVSQNKFQTIPNVMCSLQSLVLLDLSHNLINFLPYNFCELRSLHVLNLVGNDLKGASLLSTLGRMYWVQVVGGDRGDFSLPSAPLAASPFQISYHEEHEVENILRHRAANRNKQKLNDTKKRFRSSSNSPKL
jgi:Leucine rich repeat